jgi:hypothetical protein
MQSVEHSRAAVFTGRRERVYVRTSRALEFWQFINILLLSLVTGVFFGSRAMIDSMGVIMAILAPAALLATLPVLYLLYLRDSKAFYPTLVGFALFVVALLITLAVSTRSEWWYVVRSLVSVAGLAVLLATALFWRDNKKRPQP